MVFNNQKNKTKLKLIALWLILAGAGIGVIIFLGTGPVATLVKNSGQDKTPRGTVNLTLFFDANQDGEQDPLDPQEHAVGNIQIKLRNDTYRAEKTSDEQGRLLFEGVPYGDYQVSGSLKDQHLMNLDDNIKVDSAAFHQKIGLVAQKNNLSMIFGNVFFDTNNNGQLDNTDQPAASVTIALTKKAQKILTVATNQQGYYWISPRQISQYQLTINTQEGIDVPLATTVRIRSQLDPHQVQFLVSTQ